MGTQWGPSSPQQPLPNFLPMPIVAKRSPIFIFAVSLPDLSSRKFSRGWKLGNITTSRKIFSNSHCACAEILSTERDTCFSCNFVTINHYMHRNGGISIFGPKYTICRLHLKGWKLTLGWLGNTSGNFWSCFDCAWTATAYMLVLS